VQDTPTVKPQPSNDDTMCNLQIILLTLLTFISSSSFTLSPSDYYQKISEAHGYYHTNEFDKACLLFQEAFKIDTPKARDLIVAAYSHAMVNDVNKALDYLEQYFKINSNQYLDLQSIISHPAFENIKTDPNWDTIIHNAERNNVILERSLNLPLKRALDSLYVVDQQTRDMALIDSLIAKHGFPSKPVSAYFKKMNEQDKKNLNRFQELVPPGTWPGISKVGVKANLTAWLLIQHSPTVIQKKYLPFLEASAKDGDSKWEHVAGTIDRIMVEEEGMQLYGTQFGMDEEGNGFVKPIKDPDHVDHRRKKVGLIMLKHDVKRHGIEYR